MSYQFFAPDQVWTDEIIKKIRKEDNVIYHKGVFGIRIIPRNNTNPLFEVLMEDDGYLQTANHSILFDAAWSDDFISVLEDAKGYAKSHPHKFGVVKDMIKIGN